MKVWEAIAMLEQMDKTKECTVTFGEAKVAKPFSGISYPAGVRKPGYVTTPSTHDYILDKENWPESFKSGSARVL